MYCLYFCTVKEPGERSGWKCVQRDTDRGKVFGLCSDLCDD